MIYVGRSTIQHNLFVFPHTLCMNYVTNKFLLVSSSIRSKQLLCFVQGQSQKTKQTHTTKNFDQFHNHSDHEQAGLFSFEQDFTTSACRHQINEWIFGVLCSLCFLPLAIFQTQNLYYFPR